MSVPFIDADRGLGTAYERYCVYQMLDRWASKYEVGSLLEGPLDGMAGIPGTHGVGLARRGVDVVSVVSSDRQAEVTRAVYAHCGARADVRVAGEAALPELPRADLVVAYHPFAFTPDWRSYLRRVAALAKKAFVVAVCNPDNWGFVGVGALAALRTGRTLRAPDPWYTEHLAPELWELGRVREHVYFDAPWWPDLPVAPGQSLLDRAKKLFRRGPQTFTRDVAPKLATSFVYGAEKWPYLGGEGWHEELLPALLKHPTFEGASPKLRRRAAHLHAFVVDMTPRTPQARRKLRLASEPGVT